MRSYYDIQNQIVNKIFYEVLPDADIVHLPLDGDLLGGGAAPGPLHRDHLLGVLVHLLEGSLDTRSCLPKILKTSRNLKT